jgi:phage recombination protein Bet
MTKELIISSGNALDWGDSQVIATLRHTVAQGLNDAEFLLFAEHCKGTGLNPFKKEVWAIKAGGRLQVMTGINGFLAIANAHPQFDGMEIEVDCDEAPTKATCKVYRKDRKFPAVGVALLKEYGKETPIWRQMPRVMLTKVAKSIAIREAFPQELNGLYTEEEMPTQYAAPKVVEMQPAPTLAEVATDSQEAPVLYDLSTLAEDKMPAATKLLLAAGAKQMDVVTHWQSPKRVEKLKNYEVA